MADNEDARQQTASNNDPINMTDKKEGSQASIQQQNDETGV